MMYPLVRDLAAKDAPVRVPITVACRVLGFSPQAFHKWVKNPVSDRDWAEAHLINAAFDAHHDDPTFGYRFIADELADQGLPPPSGGSGGFARRRACRAYLRRRRAGTRNPARRFTTTGCSACSPRRSRTSCG